MLNGEYWKKNIRVLKEIECKKVIKDVDDNIWEAVYKIVRKKSKPKNISVMIDEEMIRSQGNSFPRGSVILQKRPRKKMG